MTGPFTRREPQVNHLDILRKFIYRLDGDMLQAERDRLESVIATYTRLYAHG